MLAVSKNVQHRTNRGTAFTAEVLTDPNEQLHNPYLARHAWEVVLNNFRWALPPDYSKGCKTQSKAHEWRGKDTMYVRRTCVGTVKASLMAGIVLDQSASAPASAGRESRNAVMWGSAAVRVFSSPVTLMRAPRRCSRAFRIASRSACPEKRKLHGASHLELMQRSNCNTIHLGIQQRSAQWEQYASRFNILA
jgi:hypothetical protein